VSPSFAARGRSELEYRVLRDESVDPRKNGIKWNLDGLDDVGRFAEIAKTLMVIGFWTALDAWTAPILFKERESIERASGAVLLQVLQRVMHM